MSGDTGLYESEIMKRNGRLTSSEMRMWERVISRDHIRFGPFAIAAEKLAKKLKTEEIEFIKTLREDSEFQTPR